MSVPSSRSPDVRTGYLENAVRETEFWRARGIARSALEAAAESNPDVQRYQIIDGRVFRVPGPPRKRADWFSSQAAAFEAALRALFPVGQPPRGNLDFVVNLGDYPVDGLPVLSTWVPAEVHNPRLPSSILWPGQREGTGKPRGSAAFDDRALGTPFSQRKNAVVWRGSATGIYDSHVRRYRRRHRLLLSWGTESPRIVLARLARRHPQLLDAAFAGFQQTNEENTRFLRRHLPVTEWVPQSWFLQHRYIVNVDGNVATSSFLGLLGSGSAVIRQASPYREFCSHQLERNYPAIPMRRDLADLPDIAAWALRHPQEGEAVAAKAREFAEAWLSGAAVDGYMRALFDEYAKALAEPVMQARDAQPV